LSKRQTIVILLLNFSPSTDGFIDILKINHFIQPEDVTVDQSGNIFVIDSGKDSLFKFTNKGKEKRLKKLFKSLSKLRSEVKKDLKSENLQEKYTALAVALIDETYARVGNTASAEELKHYGLTTWMVKHVSFSGGKAHIKFVGKSGVDQHRVIEKKELVNMLKELTKDKTIIEPTSGNMGIALAMISAAKGYRIKLFMPECVSTERQICLQAFGAEVVLTPAKEVTDGAICRALQFIEKEPDKYFMPNQFDNPNNLLSHYETTGPEIYRQTDGKVDVFVAAAGRLMERDVRVRVAISHFSLTGATLRAAP
jgi:hypothetical protein